VYAIENVWLQTEILLERFLTISVADPECLSRILIFIHPGSQLSDPGSRKHGSNNCNKRGEGKKFVVLPWRQLKKNYSTFYPMSISSPEFGLGLWDPRSGIQKTYPGSKIQGSKRYKIPDSGSATC
jgi:hypothetical protein